MALSMNNKMYRIQFEVEDELITERANIRASSGSAGKPVLVNGQAKRRDNR